MHISAVLTTILSLTSSSLAQSQASVVSVNVEGASSSITALSPGATPGPSGFMNSTRPDPSPASPSSGPGLGNSQTGAQQVLVIKVGSENNSLVFSPNTITAQPNALVQFQFYSDNHSVASSSFDEPCVPLKESKLATTAPQAGVSRAAFYSGFMPTKAQGSLTFSIYVADTSPMWFYCPQGRHCQDGMVGVINPPTSGANTLQAYAAKAANATKNVIPNTGTSSQSGGNGTKTSGTIAQSTRGAASRLHIASWELLGATLFVCFLL